MMFLIVGLLFGGFLAKLHGFNCFFTSKTDYPAAVTRLWRQERQKLKKMKNWC